MQKPRNYEETQAQGEFTPVELGGHQMVIKQVTETKSKTGKDMIVVLFDFDQSDKQPEYFMKQFRDDIRPEKKWPNQATQYILVYDEDGKCSRSFKTFTTCVKHSNPGFEESWGDNWGAQFKKKRSAGYLARRWIIITGVKWKNVCCDGLYHMIRLLMRRFPICQKHRHIKIVCRDILRGLCRQETDL